MLSLLCGAFRAQRVLGFVGFGVSGVWGLAFAVLFGSWDFVLFGCGFVVCGLGCRA